MNSIQSNLFIIVGIFIALGLIIYLIRLRKKEDASLNSFENLGVFETTEIHPKIYEPMEAVDDELEHLIEIENSLLAVKELFLKRLISAQKYVDETRLIAQQKSKY
jgi:LPXTG-motif cell wall-anchored protein